MAKNEEVSMPNMVQISSTDIPDLLEVFISNNQVPFFIGPPGNGKTAGTAWGAMEMAKRLGKKFINSPRLEDWSNPNNFCFSTVLASQIEEIDTKGLPHIAETKHGKVTVFTPTELFPSEGVGIVFLDEFPNGRTSVQNAFQEILLEHRSGAHQISKDIHFVVAGNRPQDNCGTFFIPSALRNRVAWYEVSAPRLEEWINLMKNVNKPIDPRISGFLLSIGAKHIDNFDPKKDHYAYATRRSWEFASNSIRNVTNLSLLKKLVGGWVGSGAGIELAEFLKLSDKVNIDSLLNNPKEINKYISEVGTLYSICVALIGKTKDIKVCEKVFHVMMELNADEYGVFIITGMIREYGPDGVTKRIRSAQNVGPQLMNKYIHLLRQKD